ncbi:MAG: AAA family ATPase [Peptostreptococcaceae bacterium]|nr:AAA family ATPase [Peptostreptococcaceae bacterium]
MINPNKNLILIKGEDKTDNIVKWKYSDGRYAITFSGGKTYKYGYTNVVFYKDPKDINLKINMVMKNGVALYGVVQVLKFESHTKIIYVNGYRELIENSEVTYIGSALNKSKSKNVFNYLKQIASEVGLRSEDGTNILEARYSRIDFIRKDSILASYLSGESLKAVRLPDQIIYPFGFNLSQKKAVENALRNPLSVIEGPPGTGKTQTILNIIANALMKNQSIAVVSSNNSATKNVKEKLEKYGVSFVAAYLGSGINKKTFIESQNSELPDFGGWHLENAEYERTYNEMIPMAKKLDYMLELKNNLSKLKQEIEAVITEQEYYMEYYNETNTADADISLKSNIKSNSILKLLVASEEEKTDNNFLNFILNYIRYGIKDRGFYKYSKEVKIAICQKKFYKLRISELSLEISEIMAKLEGYSFEEKMSIYSQKSLKLLKAKLAQKYIKSKSRKIYELDDLWKNSDSFIKDYPVILSTTDSLRSSLSSRFIYDYVIVDEASQVDVATGALALSCAKRAVIVGDLKQLPNVVTEKVKTRTDLIFDKYFIEEAYRYSDHSLLLSVSQIFDELPHTLLREHYRSHPKIIEFCNKKFYNGELIILTDNKTDKEPLIVYKTVEGNHSRERVNQRQIDVIKKEVIPEQGLCLDDDSVGIVTPYRNQTNCLQNEFAGTKVKADTVDKFQGQERDIIILSTVDDEITEFADNANRLNVAVSRAVKQLIVITDGNNSTKESNMKDLVEYIDYNNYELIDSKIYSTFDYLYKSYNNRRMEYLKSKKRISEYDSENLMYALLEEVLQSNENYSKLGIAVRVPLRMIIRDVKELDDIEIKYLMASGTHVDFLIYSKISKKVIMVMEVDGYHYHKEGTKQFERDLIKNAILDKYEVQYLRIKTNNSGEKDLIINKLNKVIA